MFKVMSHYSIILHHFSMQKEGGAPALTAVKWFSTCDNIASSMLVQWMSAGVY